MNITGLKAEDMRKVLKNMHDFKYEKTKVEKYITDRGHRCVFIPKYHCELNPIERVWGHVKNTLVNIVITHFRGWNVR